MVGLSGTVTVSFSAFLGTWTCPPQAVGMLPAGVGALAAAEIAGLPMVEAGAGRVLAGAGAGAAFRTTPGTIGGKEGSTSTGAAVGAAALVKKFSAATARLGPCEGLLPRTPPTVEPGAAGIPEGPPREDGGAASNTLFAVFLGAVLAGAPPNTSAADVFEEEPKYFDGDAGLLELAPAKRVLGTAWASGLTGAGAGAAVGLGT